MLETRATGLRRVEAGMAFLLLPNCWHRYRPDPVSGWDENWIEITGPVVDQILAGGVFSAETVLRSGAIDAGMDEVFDAIHRHMCNDGDQFHPDLSAAALQLLACCARIGLSRPERSRSRRLVQQAEHYLTAHHTEPVNIEGLARKFGVAYSHFRRLFRAQTGFPPWQYVLRLRLDRARRLMAASDAKLEEIARRVGFASAFHLSLAFKRTYGESPSHWRRSLAKEIGAPLCPPGAGLTASRP
jgi:AraC-like DNA-binding protein